MWLLSAYNNQNVRPEQLRDIPFEWRQSVWAATNRAVKEEDEIYTFGAFDTELQENIKRFLNDGWRPPRMETMNKQEDYITGQPREDVIWFEESC